MDLQTMKKYVIYALRDPQDNEVRYIGRTCWSPESRVSANRSKGGAGGIMVGNWLRGLEPKQPIIEILDSDCSQEQAIALERIRISEALYGGADLLNVRDRPDSKNVFRNLMRDLGYRR